MSPMNFADYHPQWSTISRQIREQAGWRCEWCNAPNGESIIRGHDGTWQPWDWTETVSDEEVEAFAGKPWEDIRFTRIVLTVAHLDHDKQNNDPANLRALCQRCHLNWDRDLHIANRRANRAARSGQVPMLLEMPA